MWLVSLVVTICCIQFGHAQFPAICNTPENIRDKTCCPNNCGGTGKGECLNMTAETAQQWEQADQSVVGIIYAAPILSGRKTVDSRYRWPAFVFERVCSCEGNYWGADCSECKFGWTGENCDITKELVIRKSFDSLTPDEKLIVSNGFRDLKSETGYWSVVVEEPSNYSGTVKLENITTYDMFTYMHNFVARDAVADCNVDLTIDFAHEGPVFPVWHRHYLLLLERQLQRVTGNEQFGLPYWKWEENDMGMFTFDYFGTPATNYLDRHDNVSGRWLESGTWPTVCHIDYISNGNESCSDGWKACNPNNDRMNPQPLQRGYPNATAYGYLPNQVEVEIAITAPQYDAPTEPDGTEYSLNSPRQSFRSRLEGWNRICSADPCVGGHAESHMHNTVHLWVGGYMANVPVAVNDPIFNLHHCNVDRVFESWIQRNIGNLPPFVPDRRGHPGHNSGDYMVPFFPAITCNEQYSHSAAFGYTYDAIIQTALTDDEIPTCTLTDVCPMCSSNGSCIHCTPMQAQSCMNGNPSTQPIEQNAEETNSAAIGLGVGFGIVIVILVAVIIILVIIIWQRSKSTVGGTGERSVEMSAISS